MESFYQDLIFLLLRVSQGSDSTGLCYASPTVWTSVDGNNYAQWNMRDRGSNSRPLGLDTILDYYVPINSPKNLSG
jgi:hypothetical protein